MQVVFKSKLKTQNVPKNHNQYNNIVGLIKVNDNTQFGYDFLEHLLYVENNNTWYVYNVDVSVYYDLLNINNKVSYIEKLSSAYPYKKIYIYNLYDA